MCSARARQHETHDTSQANPCAVTGEVLSPDARVEPVRPGTGAQRTTPRLRSPRRRPPGRRPAAEG
eukprot:12235935-Alexandrium_andersonii.AAC.1